jgi:hypothetical protein
MDFMKRRVEPVGSVWYDTLPNGTTKKVLSVSAEMPEPPSVTVFFDELEAKIEEQLMEHAHKV